MKNLHLLAISVGMAIGSAAMAEPSVTLYGIFDGAFPSANCSINPPKFK